MNISVCVCVCACVVNDIVSSYVNQLACTQHSSSEQVCMDVLLLLLQLFNQHTCSAIYEVKLIAAAVDPKSDGHIS